MPSAVAGFRVSNSLTAAAAVPSAVAGFRVSNSLTAAAAVAELCLVLWPGLGFPFPAPPQQLWWSCAECCGRV